jgi:hypothetical protein
MRRHVRCPLLAALIAAATVASCASGLAQDDPPPQAALATWKSGAFQITVGPEAKLQGFPTAESGVYFRDAESVARYHQLRAKLRPAVSAEEAQALFSFLARQPHIPFHAPENGCDFRAQEMALLLELRGVESRKAILQTYGALFDVPSPWAPAGGLHWNFHVAPVVLVQTSGGSQRTALDPALFTGPVPLESWVKRVFPGFSPATCAWLKPEQLAQLADNADVSDLAPAASCFFYEAPKFFFSPGVSDHFVGPQFRRKDWDAEDTSLARQGMNECLGIARRREHAKALGLPFPAEKCL